jgi:hypothetical protein
MTSPKERLEQLLALAAERQWSPLSRELGDLVLYWPADWPDAMRTPVLALFETALREADGETRTVLATRMAGRNDVALKVMNALYLAAPAAVRREILMRNEIEGEAPLPTMVDTAALLEAARNRSGDFTGSLSRLAGLPRAVAVAILTDASGEPLAVLCRGLGLDRASFSAMALLRGAEGTALSVFDSVAPKAAALLVQAWRKANAETVPEHVVAAE